MEVQLFKRPDSKFYWIKWYNNQGELKRQSTKTTRFRDAKKVARQKEEVILRTNGIIDLHTLTMKDLVEEVENDHKINNKKSINKVIQRKKHLYKFFSTDNNTDTGNQRLMNVSENEIEQYKKRRSEEGAAPATINRELSIIRRGFNLLRGRKKVAAVPTIKTLSEDNVRTGFFENWEYHSLLKSLPDYLRPVVQFAYACGWRKEEILNLEWDIVDLEEKVITLPPGYTKNKKGRTYPLDKELLTMFQGLWDERTYRKNVYVALIKENKKPEITFVDSPYVFLNRKKTDKIRDFRFSWKKACKDAGIRKRYFHDFRRTAVRSLIRSRNPEKVVMSITGHLTRSVFERYHIVSTEDLEKAVERQREYLIQQDKDKPKDGPKREYYVEKEVRKVFEQMGISINRIKIEQEGKIVVETNEKLTLKKGD